MGQPSFTSGDKRRALLTARMGGIPETTLSSPLLEASYEQFEEMAQAKAISGKSEVGRLVLSLKTFPGAPNPASCTRHTASLTPCLSTIGSDEGLITAEMAVRAITRSRIFLDRYLSSLKTGIHTSLGADIKGLTRLGTDHLMSPLVVTSFRDVLYWINLVEYCVAASKEGGWVLVSNAWCSRRFCIINHHGKNVLLTYDAVLMFKDMMYSRFLVNSLAALDPTRVTVSSRLAVFVAWCNDVLVRFGNEGYELIKGIEALAKVRIILRVEKWLDAQAQADEMVSKYVRKELGLGGDGRYIKRLWAFLVSVSDTSEVSEIFGFVKLAGHPYVNPRQGCRKVQKILHTPDPKDLAACQEVGRSFCHLYTRGFLESQGKWPRLQFRLKEDGRQTTLERLCLKNQPVLAFGFTQYDSTDWDYATFLPHLVFDHGADILDLMSDRALSHPRTTFDTVWFGKLDYNPPRPVGSKRVLEQLLMKEDLNMADVVRRVQTGNIPFDWKIVSVSPKEREMKLDPRMFSKMVIEMRSFFVLTEKNLKTGIFKYLKEQTMTLNRQELLSRFLTVTKPTSNRWVKLTIEIDYSSWNLHFDTVNTDPVGIRLNEIYGTPGVFTAAHRFFSECIVVMDNGDYPPEGLTGESRDRVLGGVEELDTVWSGHDRGFEGITQGIWTAITIALGHYAIQDLGIPFVQNGQGDNQVYCFDVYIPDGVHDDDIRSFIRDLERKVLHRLSTAAHQVGHEIKPEECVCSTAYFSYGKEMFANGQYIPSLAKFLSRIFPTTSSDAPSTYEYIATVASGGTAATEKSNVSLPCLALGKFVEHMTITREFHHSLLHQKELGRHLELICGDDRTVQDTVIDLLAIVPGNLGGLPVSTPLEFLYRGHSDPLASSLASMFLMASFPGVDEYLVCLDKGWMFKKEPEAAGLIFDPYSLPLDSSPPSSSLVASRVAPVLLSAVRNKSLAVLKDVASGEDRDDLYSWLSSQSPLYPKVAHDLYKSSAVGVLDGLAKRFTNTRTLMTMARNEGHELTGLSIGGDYLYVTSMVTRFIRIFKVNVDHSTRLQSSESYSILCRWRQAWGYGHLEGVTNLHPLLSGRVLTLPGDYSHLTGTAEIVVMCPSGSSVQCETTRGPFTPFLGTKTDDKTVGKWVRPIDSSPPLRDVIKILTIQAMMSLPGSEMWESLENLARTRTSVDLEILRNFVRLKIGGTIAHRYQTRDDPKGSFVNVSVNWPTHLTVSTNLAGDLGGTDYPFDFTEAITLLQGLLTWSTYRTPLDAPFGMVLKVDTSRMDPVGDHIVECVRLYQPPAPQSHSYYLTVNQVTISENATSSARFIRDDILGSVPESEPDIDAALVIHVLNHLTGSIPTRALFGHTMGVVAHRRLIDLPELRKLTYTRFVRAVAAAVRMKVSYAVVSVSTRTGQRSITSVLQKLVNTEVRRSVPSLFGTLRELSYGGEEHIDGLGLGAPESSRELSHIMADVQGLVLQTQTELCVQLYLRGSSSLSKVLSAALCHELVRIQIDGDPTAFRNTKLVRHVLAQILHLPDEVTRTRHLLSLYRVLDLDHLVTQVNSSPEETLRRLRTEPCIELTVCPKTYRYGLFPTTVPHLRPGYGNRTSYVQYHPSPERLAEAWMQRRTGTLEQALRWSPVTSLVDPGVQTVLLIGVGDGRLGPALDPKWDVVGVELGRVLASQGQAMVDYRPPGIQGGFSLHRASWALGGDIRDPLVLTSLLAECRNGAYDLVIIDVEGEVQTRERLTYRQLFAETGIPSVCKVLVDPTDSPQFVTSYLAYYEVGDCCWSVEAYPYEEFYVGFSPAPLGLYQGLPGEVVDVSVLPLVRSDDVAVSHEDLEDLQVLAVELTGDFHDFGRSPLLFSRCKALRAYLPPAWSSHLSLLSGLIRNRAPRRRVKHLSILLQRHLIEVPTTRT